MGHPAADIFRQAAGLNLQDTRRGGNTIRIEPGMEMIVSGDLHGYRVGLAKLLAYAQLDQRPNRRLILQEIVHGPADAATGQDRSIELLLRAARLKVAHPLQVVFILGNHDIAQVTGNEITKDGCGTCKAFCEGVRFSYPDACQEVMAAVNEFLLSMAIAALTPGGVFIAHSLPSPNRMEASGLEILSRPTTQNDLHRGQPAYEWTWGRQQTPQQLDSLAEKLGVTYFILGHRHSDSGCEVVSPRGVALTTGHPCGQVAVFGSDEPLSGETICEHLKPVLSMR